jgi:dihydropteroate synthase
MGICNVTPDSFSDGGAWASPEAALAHCQDMLAEGADLIDVGGESTRPGAGRVTLAEEMDRVMPVVGPLARSGVVVSIDTMRSEVAAAAVAAGALIINDVSGGLADPAILEVAAQTGAVIVLMDWRGPSDQMDQADHYGDVAGEVRDSLARRVEAGLAAGIRAERMVVDPGLGFGKVGQSNWDMLAGLDRLDSLGLPILVGASRKRFLGPWPRDHATAAVTAIAAAAGVWAVRVHSVPENLAAAQVGGSWRASHRD